MIIVYMHGEGRLMGSLHPVWASGIRAPPDRDGEAARVFICWNAASPTSPFAQDLWAGAGFTACIKCVLRLAFKSSS